MRSPSNSLCFQMFGCGETPFRHVIIHRKFYFTYTTPTQTLHTKHMHTHIRYTKKKNVQRRKNTTKLLLDSEPFAIVNIHRIFELKLFTKLKWIISIWWLELFLLHFVWKKVSKIGKWAKCCVIGRKVFLTKKKLLFVYTKSHCPFLICVR